MADEQGVTGSESPTEGNQEIQDVNVQSSSTQDVPASSPDRSIENMFREMQRKQQESQRQVDAVLAWIGAQAQQQRPQPQTQHAEVTDEDLWTAAQQGDRAAYDQYHQRLYNRQFQQQQAVVNRSQAIAVQIQALSNRYPSLRDEQHPLKQLTNQAYIALVQRGYPQGN